MHRDRAKGMRSIGFMIGLGMMVVGAAACSQSGTGSRMGAMMGGGTALTGAQEVPAVNTQATGVSSIIVNGDKNISGEVRTTNLNGTAAHIHLGAMGQNGPVIIPLAKTADGVWTVPANTTLTSAQFDAYRAGDLYVNVHSAANPSGEIRAQIKP